MTLVCRSRGFHCCWEMSRLDRFPEAFRRFESDVNVSRLRSYNELLSAFRWWAGWRWAGTAAQMAAFDDEAHRLGFEVERFFPTRWRRSYPSSSYGYETTQKAVSYRHEVINVNGKPQNRYRDISTGRFVKKL